MKPVIDVYFGSPIDITSEKEFLDKLVSDLRARNESAFIFANFHTGKNTLQVDFFVVTSKCACHVEQKKITLHLSEALTVRGNWLRLMATWKSIGIRIHIIKL